MKQKQENNSSIKMFRALRKQATIAKKVNLKGKGVHSGLEVSLEILPAAPDHGIVFERTDKPAPKNLIKLTPENVVEPVMCTKVCNEQGLSVSVIEHLMAALRIAEVSNALIKVSGEEIPIMDGSAAVFLEVLLKAKIVKQNAEVPAIVIESPITLSSDKGSILVAPSWKSSFEVFLDYERINRVIKNNDVIRFSWTSKGTVKAIAESRTFGWLADCEVIRQKGMAKGASLENTLIINEEDRVINKGGLRHKKEIVGHKALDLIGDFSLFGFDIIGAVKGINTSHLQNNLFLRKLLAEKQHYSIISTSADLEDFLSSSQKLLQRNLQLAS